MEGKEREQGPGESEAPEQSLLKEAHIEAEHITLRFDCVGVWVCQCGCARVWGVRVCVGVYSSTRRASSIRTSMLDAASFLASLLHTSCA
jgi:hypothetical protein